MLESQIKLQYSLAQINELGNLTFTSEFIFKRDFVYLSVPNHASQFPIIHFHLNELARLFSLKVWINLILCNDSSHKFVNKWYLLCNIFLYLDISASLFCTYLLIFPLFWTLGDSEYVKPFYKQYKSRLQISMLHKEQRLK